MQCKWIWYPGDFEIYHTNLVHSRREDFGIDYPPFWIPYSPFPRVQFWKDFKCCEPHTIQVHSRSYGMVRVNEHRFPLNGFVDIPAGENKLIVDLFDTAGLPAIYIDDSVYGTDSSWQVSNGSANSKPAGDEPVYSGADADPRKFEFSYLPLAAVSVENCTGGRLFDFGKETYGPVNLKDAAAQDTIFICYGESREEALDAEHAYVRQTVSGQGQYALVPRAFRYLFISGDTTRQCRVEAAYEYLPLSDVGDFECEDPMVKKIWDVCSYTFHLNSREFYQDGIKRDRWVWSGDSYQSFMINRYLYFDPAIIRRTIVALLGKPPYEQHINTINDYTLYLIIGIWEYYFSTGDLDFIRFLFPRVKALFDFAAGRLDEDGQMVRRFGDWIFIDWSEMDKDGPLCAEQILLWKAEECMAGLAGLCGEPSDQYTRMAASLKDIIDTRYWDKEKGAYIDTYATGKRNVTRHANIFAILYDFADDERKKMLMKNVLNNPAVTRITTPFFMFFELSARCRMGDLETAQKLLISYWGGMLKDGATSIWEQYNPEAHGAEHYAMYGEAFGCSLCHAWGSGPIYFLGRYCLGVAPTEVGYKTFTVAPQIGMYHKMKGIVPLPKNGWVKVEYADGKLRVLTNRNGGTLQVEGRSCPLQAGVVLELSCAL